MEVAGETSCLSHVSNMSQLRTADLPSGPSTSSTLGGSILVIFFFRFIGGSRSRRLTSAGSDKGAEPTRDAHLDELENGCDEKAMAETRKSGNDTIGLCSTLKSPAGLVVAAM